MNRELMDSLIIENIKAILQSMHSVIMTCMEFREECCRASSMGWSASL